MRVLARRTWPLALVACSTASGEAHRSPAPVAPAAASPPTPSNAAPASAQAPGDPSKFPDGDASSKPAGLATELRQQILIRRMLVEVEKARGLEAGHPVRGAFLNREELMRHVKAHVARELPPEAMRDEGLSLQLLGFVPTKFDYEAAEYRMLQDQLAGYYEPADGTMYMATDLDDEEASATLAHELVHALQDRHWDLERRSTYRPGEGDAAEAVSALAEGDATSAMFDVMIGNAGGARKTALDVPDETFVAQIERGVAQGAGGEPHVMGTSLAAPYIYGTVFVNTLRRRGGWKAVDAAWENPPVTTEQILHVDKWLAHEPALAVPAPTFATLGSGWKLLEEDSEGELGSLIAFEEWLGLADAREASAGWGGDRSVLVTAGGRSAFAWRLRYDRGRENEGRAAWAFQNVAGALERRYGRPQNSDAAFVCHERADRGPIALLRNRSDLVLVLGPAATETSAWRSAGSCAQSRQWIREIVNAKE